MHYVVKHGDTLGNIAYEHGTTVHAIMAANGLTNPDLIHVGQTLIIPGHHHHVPLHMHHPLHHHHPVHMHHHHPMHMHHHHPHHHIERRLQHMEMRVQHLEHRIDRLEHGHIHH